MGIHLHARQATSPLGRPAPSQAFCIKRALADAMRASLCRPSGATLGVPFLSPSHMQVTLLRNGGHLMNITADEAARVRARAGVDESWWRAAGTETPSTRAPFSRRFFRSIFARPAFGIHRARRQASRLISSRAPRYIIPNLLGYAHGVRVIWRRIAPKRSTAGGSLNYYTLLPSAVGMGSNQWHLVGANKYREGLTAKR